MKNKYNIINNCIVFVCVITLFVLVASVGRSYSDNIWRLIGFLVLGTLIALFFSTLFHELGHVLLGKLNGFVFSSLGVLFFKLYKDGKKIKFSFSSLKSEAGYSEMIPKTENNIEKRYKRMIAGGIIFSIVPIVIGIASLLLKAYLSDVVFCIFAMFLPIGVYSFLDNALPMVNDGLKNDGAMLLSCAKKNDSFKVIINSLKIQALLYEGKTYSEIDESYYFDLPQLPEDDYNFFVILYLRYFFYLDKGDFKNAKKTIERLISLEEYFSKDLFVPVKLCALYGFCTYDLNAEQADELVYELENYLNNVNDAMNVIVKIAYLLNVCKERESIDKFYNKALREIKKSQVIGVAKFEKKLLSNLVNVAEL